MAWCWLRPGRIIEAAESLDSLPGRGRVVPAASDDSIRELIFGSYRIIYRLDEERVLLLTVIPIVRSQNPKSFQ